MSSTKARALTPLTESLKSLPSKLYFRIGEVAGMVGVEPHVLRYWEREFRAIRPTKSSKGQRVYSRKDVENLLRVRALLYEEGFTIAGAKKKLSRSPGESDALESAEEAHGSSAHETERESPPPRETKATTPSRKVAHASEALAQGVQALASPSKPLAVTAPLTLSAPVAQAEASELVALAKASRHAEDLRQVRTSLLELRTELEALLGELEAE